MKLPLEKNNEKLYWRETRCCMPTQRRFTCPLTNSIMEDPVSVPCCGTNFERRALLRWMKKNGSCPESGESLRTSDLKPNAMLQWEILYLERKTSCKGESSSTKVSSSLPIPSPSVDTPPSMPRSSTGSVRTEQSERRPSLNESNHSRADLPPTLPRNPSSPSTRSMPIKRMDSAPSLPRRSFGPNIYEIILMAQNAVTSHNETFTGVSGPSKSNDLISLLDDVLAVLSDDEL